MLTPCVLSSRGRVLLVVATMVLATFVAAWCHAADRPNIVYILADDYGWGDVGAYNPQVKVPTPNIDRLAREGMRFTDAHSGSAVCSPTRYGILTGRYAWRGSLKSGVLRPYDPPLIEAGRLTVPAMLKQEGYQTACVGKWHLGWNWPREGDKVVFDRAIPDGPTTRGFDYYFGTDVPNYPPYCFLENDRTVGQPTAEKPVANLDGRIGPMLPGWQFDAILPTLCEKACQYVAKQAGQREPFFLYFTLTSPHEPIAPSAAFRGKSGINPIGDFLMETDWVVGQMLNTLEKSGLKQNTLVFFTGDNGHSAYTGLKELQAAGHEPSGPFRAYKGALYEGGHRVPFVARWPGKIPAGSTCDETICHTNLMATCAAIVGAAPPPDAGEDSFSILPLLLNEQPAKPTHPAVVHHSVSGQFAIRRGPWKYIGPAPVLPKPGQKAPAKKAKPTEPAEQLYNLQADAAETKNVAAEHPDVVRQLRELLERYRTAGGSRE